MAGHFGRRSDIDDIRQHHISKDIVSPSPASAATYYAVGRNNRQQYALCVQLPGYRMPDRSTADAYLIDSDEEMLRLERQAAIYGIDDDLKHLALRRTDKVLDAGCGAGAITRTIARAVPEGHATGLDR